MSTTVQQSTAHNGDPQQQSDPCVWCGLDDCDNRPNHEALDRASETTWRRQWQPVVAR